MKRLILLLLFPIAVFGQAWSTFLDPSRAIDWNANSGAGFTIPNYVINCSVQPSLLAGSANAAANGTSIANSIASCDATHNVVSIPAGTWFYNTIFIRKSNVVIRGAGPNNTTLIPTVGTNCVSGKTVGICFLDPANIFAGSGSVTPPSGTQQCAWTGGYAQGSTNTITINACGGTAPPVGQIIVMDQVNDGATDTGGVYICDDRTLGCSVQTSGNNNGRTDATTGLTRSQQQLTKVTAVTNNGGGSFTLTISPGVYFTNIRTSQNPGIWWGHTIQNVGVENLSIDGTTMSSGAPTNFGNIGLQQCYQCWVKGVRSMNAGRFHIQPAVTFEDTIRDSYFYGALGGASQSYTVEFEEVSGMLIENNIMQNVTNPIMQGQGSGNVIDYNFSIFSFYTAGSGQFAQGAYGSHNAGNIMNLYEGNDFLFGPWTDCEFGGMAQMTVFRQSVPAFQPSKTSTTIPIIDRCHDRENNHVGNVLGTTGYHTQYESYATSGSGGVGFANESTSIYSFGWMSSSTPCTGSVANQCDATVRTSMMRWGNWDAVNGAIRWDSTEASPPAAFGVNANFTSSYFSTLAHTLPNSLYYTSTPSWWPSGIAYPPIGPDISGGNLKKCSGGTYNQSPALTSAQCTGGSLVTDWGSHINAIPARVCYLITMAGPPDGTGAVLPFDAPTCYTASAGTPIGTLSPASLTFNSQVVGTSSLAQSFTFTNTGTAALVISTITLTGDYSQTNNCPFSTPGLGIGQSCTFNVIFTPTAAGTRNGTITITSNASNNPSTELLIGTGVVSLTIENGTIIINGASIQN